jgi:hypothetical protein
MLYTARPRAGGEQEIIILKKVNKKNMKKNMQYIVGVVVLVIVAGGAFYGGMLYKGSQAPQRSAGQAGRTGTRFAAGTNFIAGSIIAKDAQSITIKDKTGSSRIIFYSDSTDVGKFIQGSMTDIVVGQDIMVNGKTNSDGSVTAQSIQIRPAMPTAGSNATSGQ